MAVFRSRVSVASEDFRRNREGMLALIGELRELEAQARLASERSAERFAHRGQLLPRERLARVLDPGAPFLELQNLTGDAMTENVLDADRATSVPGGNQLVGIGFVSGARCVVVVTDSGINAGAFNAAGGAKILRAQAIAAENRLPFLHLVESAGANIPGYRVEA